ncbi:MAG: purine-nucleoside phosphorylase [Candidatus Marinimicrobia bacterium]|nr:purine-nucleoside phosphorylase [Candidatus Neomarinimicrobiota bacterium]MCF7840085.1 purine-nucleoside phosphorylase [Candidatus Neomarinimicrobiota bacterium]MCF7902356.1 purine-nucleoside phosphorylase [Candidatus Neomarinimicrobiota bacterium]
MKAQQASEHPVQSAVEAIQKHGDFQGSVGLVLGSGLGHFAQELTETAIISYHDIPNFPQSTVEGHSGELVCGRAGDLQVLVMRGRVHFYEGYSLDQVVFPIQVLYGLGARTLIITNAAGSVNTEFSPGDLMVIDRQLNLTGHSVVEGDEPLRPYLRRLGDLVERVGREMKIPIRRGCYGGLTGPSYETPAEIRFLRHLGADAVGMSTIHETIQAYQLGMEVLGISCLTNYAAGILDQPLSHEEVIATGKRIEKSFSELLHRVLAQF